MKQAEDSLQEILIEDISLCKLCFCFKVKQCTLAISCVKYKVLILLVFREKLKGMLVTNQLFKRFKDFFLAQNG